MTSHDRSGPDEAGSPHDAVGAYVLGVLDDADATAFEEHLAGCELCGARLEEFSGMESMLAALADSSSGATAPEVPGGRERSGGSSGRETPGRERPGRERPGRGAPAAGDVPDRGPVLRSVPTAGPGSVPAQGRTGGAGTAGPAAPAIPVRPSPHLLDRLVDEVATQRARRRRRGFYLAAAAAVLIVGGPTATVLATSGDQSPATSQAAGANDESAYFRSLPTKVSATDPATKVSATVGLESTAWGTDAVMELKNVKGPLKCSLVAVSKSGDREVVTSWSVSEWGYGLPGSSNPFARKPLYVHGGAAVQPKDIDHFDVMTSDGKRLVRVPA